MWIDTHARVTLDFSPGPGKVVGAELVRNPDVAKISFPGSVAVGETTMRDGAATMKRVTLELGGKSPLFCSTTLRSTRRSRRPSPSHF